MPTELRELLGRSPNMPDNETEEMEDITEEFFRECEKLNKGQVVMMQGFRLSDAMSAVELMDPKMDIGIHRYTRTITTESLTQEGYFNKVSDPEVLAIVDATLCCLASYLNGGNICNTLYTNVLLFRPQAAIPHPALDCLAKTMSHIAPLVRSIISTAMVYEEEDFNGNLPYFVPIVMERDDLLKMIKDVELTLIKDSSESNPIRAILASRFTWMRLFLEVISAMVPPMRQDDDALDGKGFKPDLDLAGELVYQLIRFIPTAESAKFGAFKLDENGQPLDFKADGKFEWLRVFDPDFNKMYLTGSFPRATIIPSREDGLKHFYSLSHRLRHIACEMRKYLENFEGIRDLLRSMCDRESCILSRSVLQLTLIPYDDMVLGEFQLSELVERSVQNFTQCLVMREGSTASKDEKCINFFNDFIDDFSRIALTIVAHYGLNCARQREKLVHVIEEVCSTIPLAEMVDERTKEVNNEELEADKPRNALPLYHYIYDTVIFLMENHIELTIDLELLSPHEYASTYWFYGEVVMRWPISALQQFLESKEEDVKKGGQLQEQDHESRNRYDRIAHRMLLMHARKNICTGVVYAAYALTKAGFITIRSWDENSEKLRYAQRMSAFKSTPFYQSYESYLNNSAICDYMQMPLPDLWKRAIDTFDLAKNQFSKIESLYAGTRLPLDVVKNLNYVCKSNSLACRLLASGQGAGRNVQWSINKTKSLSFPVIKMC